MLLQKRLFHRLLCAGLLACASQIAMAGLTVKFFNGSDLYAEMTTSSSTNFDLYFVGEGVASGAYIDYLLMDGPSGTFANLGTDAIATGTYAANGFADQGDVFDWKIQFPNKGSNGGALRLTAGEHGLWTISITDPDVWDFSKIHINAFDANLGSIKLDGCVAGLAGCGGTPPNAENPELSNDVPEPASLTLAGAALAAALWANRRRRTGAV